MAKTKPLAAGITKPMNDDNADISNRLIVSENIIFDGKNGQYEIFADKRIGIGGEAQVFIAQRLSDKKEVVAKIYDEYHDTFRNNMNRQKAIEFVLNHSNYSETYILPILDFGTISINSIVDDRTYIKPIDIIPYCSHGEIKKADYETLRNEIIPQVLHAINLMHKSNIVHRDIKPGNIYKYKDQTVVADFGTASEISSSKFTGTTQKRGTLGYTAPEVWQGYVVTASDYFSLGCTIASIYKGEHVYQRLFNLEDEGAINNAINTYGLPLNCPEDEEDLQILVDALAEVDESERAGYDDVILWLKDSVAFERKFKLNRKNMEDDSFTFHFESIVCRNMQQLINALASNWEIAKKYLYRGGIKNSAIVNFFSKINQSLAVKLGEIIEEKDTATNYDLGLAKALHYMNNAGPLYWQGKSYKKLSDISEAISSQQAANNEINTMLSSKYISWKLQNSTGSMKDSIDAVKNIEAINEKHPKLAYHLTMYKFAKEPSKQSYNGLKTPDEIFASISKTPNEFYQNCQLILDDNEMFAYLTYIGYTNYIEGFKTNQTDKLTANIELLYRLFEAICLNKTAIREHYYKYGPKSHLHWLQQNLGLYEFNSSQANKIKDNILNIKFTSEAAIDELSRNFMKLEEYQKDFLNLFQGNILLAMWGITCGKEKTGITSSNSDAYYLKSFCDTAVPVGYFKYMHSKI